MTTIQLRDDITTADAELDQRAPESDDADRAETPTDPPEAAAAPADKPRRARRARKVREEAAVRGHANGLANGSAAFAVSPPDVDSIEARVNSLVGEIRDGVASCNKREAEEISRHEGAMSALSQERGRYHAQLSKLGAQPAAVRKPEYQQATARKVRPKTPAARMARRSAEDINSGVQRVVDHLKKHADGQRAEQIKADLGIDRKSLPKLLKTAIASKLIRCRGFKRATTYTAR